MHSILSRRSKAFKDEPRTSSFSANPRQGTANNSKSKFTGAKTPPRITQHETHTTFVRKRYKTIKKKSPSIREKEGGIEPPTPWDRQRIVFDSIESYLIDADAFVRDT